MRTAIALLATVSTMNITLAMNGQEMTMTFDPPYVSTLDVETLAPDYCVASWYGGGEALNTHTASGDVFDPEGLTVAAWDYPFGTVLTVWRDGVSVDVTVNDRGPHGRLGRCLDLSRAAFDVLASLDEGLVEVIYVVNEEG